VKERKDRVEDAMHATRAAVEEGIVPGGGVALLYAAAALDKLQPANDDQRVGIGIVRRALQGPVRQIAENAGSEGSVVVGKLLEKVDRNRGYDAQTGTFVDMFKAGIIDPTKVVRIALQDAGSIAGLLVTTCPLCPTWAAWVVWVVWACSHNFLTHRERGRWPLSPTLVILPSTQESPMNMCSKVFSHTDSRKRPVIALV
jgi:hypothetical protein